VDDVKEIVKKTLIENRVIQRLIYTDTYTNKTYEKYRQIPFYSTQKRHVLRRVGLIDPDSIRDYIAHGGYAALCKALSSWTPDSVIDEIEHSGLRGRGGGGFQTGRKWRSCANTGEKDRYIICNGDEGDPGAFMDCSIMEGDPHAIIEGMIIGAFAVKAIQGYIYVREEYPRALKCILKAINEAKEWGFLGNSILGTDFSFDIKINRGAGAFVCGESTALMQSIAGNVGEPRAKYIRSVEQGLYGRPTVLNNVETFANIPLIIEKGAEWYASRGTAKSKGTKIFSVVGKVKNTGLVEVPMGTTLRSIIFDTCGGILNDRQFKAVQTGGPSGGCLPKSKLDLPVDFDTLSSEKSMMGSGGMIVMDEDTCMVDVAHYFTKFLTEESCGKCTACRMGLNNLKEILQKICSGNGTPDDITKMEKLFNVLDEGSLCGLGKSAANPVRSTLTHFRDEYEAHIGDKKCPAGVCRDLITYSISESCTGCRICAENCPQKAIYGNKKEIHIIDKAKCNRCGICTAYCQFDSIAVV
jgi:NADH-quinone oxidoreductase subunit F